MVKEFHRTDWLKDLNTEQLQKVFESLVEKKVCIKEPQDRTNPDYLKKTLVLTLEHLAYSSRPNIKMEPFEAKDLINKLRATLRQKKHSKKVEKSGRAKHGFTILKSSRAHLTNLANQKNLGISETVELLIERGFDYEKEAKAELLAQKKAAKKLKEDQAKAIVEPKVNVADALPNAYVDKAAYNKVKSELELTQKLFKELESKALGHLNTMCEYIIRNESSEVPNRSLIGKEKKKLKEMFKEKKKALLELVNSTETKLN